MIVMKAYHRIADLEKMETREFQQAGMEDPVVVKTHAQYSLIFNGRTQAIIPTVIVERRVYPHCLVRLCSHERWWQRQAILPHPRMYWR